MTHNMLHPLNGVSVQITGSLSVRHAGSHPRKVWCRVTAPTVGIAFD